MSEDQEQPIATIWQDRFIKREYLPAGELARRFNVLNPRSHPEAQTDAIESSLDTVGWFDEISLSTNGDGPASLVDNPDARMFDGHDRVELVLMRGGESALVPVKWYQLSKEETDFALLVKDQTTGMAELIPDKLAALMERTRAMTADKPALSGMLDKLRERAGVVNGGNGGSGDGLPIPTETEAERLAKEYGVQVGQVWQLGRHKIACGDSLDEVKVRELIGADKVGMVWADPPYGISAVDTDRKTINSGNPYPFGGLGKVTGTVGSGHLIPANRYAPVVGDESTGTAKTSANLLLSLYSNAVHIWWGANHYSDILPASPCWVIWDKRDDLPSNDFADGEMAWVKSGLAIRIFRHRWSGLVKASEHNQRRVHPTQKPIALAHWCFEKYGQANDLIFDPFLGSGISILAAEQLSDNRRVIGMELAPEYIAVTIHRWQQLTRLEPKLISS